MSKFQSQKDLEIVLILVFMLSIVLIVIFNLQLYSKEEPIMNENIYEITSKIDNIVDTYTNHHAGKEPGILLIDMTTWNRLLCADTDDILMDQLQQGKYKGMEVLFVIEPKKLESREVIICGGGL